MNTIRLVWELDLITLILNQKTNMNLVKNDSNNIERNVYNEAQTIKMG